MRRGLGIVGLSWVLLASCHKDYECDEETGCAFGATCVQGVCVEAVCATSSQCPIEHYCGSGRQCVEGCQVDGDCLPGDRCDTELGECVAEGCVETSVDCGFREFCNTATGECYDAGGDYCKPCDPDSDDCGEGNLCINHACTVDCSGGRECPAGFECYPFANDVGEIVAHQCFTYCWLYDEYEPGSFVREIPDLPSGPLPMPPSPETP